MKLEPTQIGKARGLLPYNYVDSSRPGLAKPEKCVKLMQIDANWPVANELR